MIISAVDERKDLFSVSGIVPTQLIDQISQDAVLQIPYGKQDWQNDIARRKLQVQSGSILEQIQTAIDNKKDLIGESIQKTINKVDSVFWLDEQGFTFSPHIDNPGVDQVMQIYLSDCVNAGTVFYNVDNHEVVDKDDDQHWHYEGAVPPTSIRHTFEFKNNTGYVMINNRTQLHGVPHTLGKTDFRLSVYCWFN